MLFVTKTIQEIEIRYLIILKSMMWILSEDLGSGPIFGLMIAFYQEN
jgi:hypothetical protein